MLDTKDAEGRDDRCGCSEILILDAEQNPYNMKISCLLDGFPSNDALGSAHFAKFSFQNGNVIVGF